MFSLSYYFQFILLYLRKDRSIAFAIFIGISGLSLLFMSPKLLKKFKPTQVLIKMMSQLNFETYQLTKSLHNFTIVALVFMQIHVLMTSSAQANPFIFSLYMVYFFLATGFYLYHKLIKAWLLEDAKGKGVGTALVNRLIEIASENNIWTLQAGIIRENTPSRELHLKCGFREVGFRERLGQMDNGKWHDVLLYERRQK